MPHKATGPDFDLLVWLAVSLYGETATPQTQVHILPPEKTSESKTPSSKKAKKTFEAIHKQQIFEAIASIAGEGKELSFKNFGSFSLLIREARYGINPKTGEELEIPASYHLHFKCASALKQYTASKENLPTIGIPKLLFSYFPEHSQKTVRDSVRCFLRNIAEEVKEKERLYMRGFGTFKLKKRKERRGRNPMTGEVIVIKAASTISFAADKIMQAEVMPKDKAFLHQYRDDITQIKKKAKN